MQLTEIFQECLCFGSVASHAMEIKIKMFTVWNHYLYYNTLNVLFLQSCPNDIYLAFIAADDVGISVKLWI